MEYKKYLKLNDIEAYRISFALSSYIWQLVMQWNTLAQNTIGQQYIRAADSISANIDEGFGRQGKKEKVQFFRYARGSVYECLDWKEKCRIRKLLTQEDYYHIFSVLQNLPKMLNSLIKVTNTNLQQ